MDKYLVDYEVLGGFVDELMKMKPIPAQNTEELNAIREEKIKSLDDKISNAIIDSLDDDQKGELSTLLDKDNGDPSVYRSFFKRIGVDLENVVLVAMQTFKTEFLGGNL